MVRLARYSRQYILPQIGLKGQQKLLESRVAIIGGGALGCQSLTLLARGGVGFLRIIDREIVEIENLHRQILYNEKDIGKPKALVAEAKLKKVNSDIKIEAIVDDANFTNILKFIEDIDVIVDGTDNMETRYLINDACVKTEKPYIYGGAISTYGMTMNIIPKKTACFRCLFPKMAAPGSLPTCETVGVLNTVPAIIASLQVTNVFKILLGRTPSPNLTIFDAWTNELKEITVKRRKKCVCCSQNHFEFLNAEKKELLTSLCGGNSISINPLSKGKINLGALAKRLKRLGDVNHEYSILFFKLKDYELTIFQDGRAIIKGTNDEKVAKSLYSKYIGH